MRKRGYFGIVILFLVVALLSSSVNGICLIKGFIFNSDGTAADSGITVKIRLAGNDLVYPVLTGGHVSNFYLQSVYQCRTGEDVAIVEVELEDYKATVSSLLASPYQDINITLLPKEDYKPLIFDETSFIEKESTVGRLVQIKDGKETAISPLDTILYEFKGFNQKFEIKYIGYPFIAGVFPNLGSSIGQAVGAVEQYDLDLNGALDTEINLVDIEANRAKLIFRSITEVFPKVVNYQEDTRGTISQAEEEQPLYLFEPQQKTRLASSLLLFIAFVLICWLIINLFLLIKDRLDRTHRK